jgi:hypothetical protein
MGKLASLIPIVGLWKPYYLFTSGFKESVSVYWNGAIRNYAISAFAFAAGYYTLRFIPLNPYKSIWEWLSYAAVGMVIFLTYDLTATFLFAKGAKDSLSRIKKLKN